MTGQFLVKKRGGRGASRPPIFLVSSSEPSHDVLRPLVRYAHPWKKKIIHIRDPAFWQKKNTNSIFLYIGA